jgi:PAS domain S-box-containing protein
MEQAFILLNSAVIVALLAVTWWYARSTSRLLRQAQNQVAAIEEQAIAKIAELQTSYAQILREIAERRQAEDRLRESEARFAAFMQHLPGTAAMRDARGRFLFANETWEKVFGRKREDWWEKTMAEIWSSDLALPFLEMDRRVIDGGQPLESIETLEHMGQEHFWLMNRFPIPSPDDQAVMLGAIGIDITGRLRAEEALKASEKKLRALTAQLLSAQESERKRLAAELHDQLGHALLTLKLRMEALVEQLQPQQVSLKGEVRKILGFISATIAEVRRLYLDLSPGDLEDLGLTAALHSLIEDFMDLQKNLAWTVNLDNLDGLFPLPIQTAIYRVVQEALTNIGKHANPKQVSLEVKRGKTNVSFAIRDDGLGFDKQEIFAAKKTLGLLAMEERVKILGGAFTLSSQKNQGTRISFTIPLPAGGSSA